MAGKELFTTDFETDVTELVKRTIKELKSLANIHNIEPWYGNYVFKKKMQHLTRDD